MVSFRPFILCMTIFVVMFVSVSNVEAQSTGKISGQVLDAATGESLPGVNVFLEENTYLGTVTDADGKYFLLSVPPGNYTLVMSFVGFSTLKTADVQVFSGRTTTVDGRLAEEVFQGEEIVVSADRPIVIRDRTTTVSFVSRETIESLPVTEVSDLVRFQPGVVTNADGGFNFRGGRQRETAYIVDGIPVQDVFNQGGGNTIDLEVQSIQELQVFTGTFDAELGGAQSGVVSLTTRDPGQKLEGNLKVQGSGFFANDNGVFTGTETFDPVESKDVSLTLSGPIIKKFDRLGFFLTSRYEDRVGHLKGVEQFLPEDGFEIETYRRWYRDLFQPDDTRLITLDTARTPAGNYILGRDGNPITFGSGDGSVVNMDWRRSFTFNPKFVFRPTSRSSLTFGGIYNQSEGQGYSNASRFAPAGRDQNYFTSWTGIASYKQVIGNDKVLNLRGSYKFGESESRAFDSIDDPRLQFISATDDVTGFSLGSTSNGEFRRTEEQIIVSGDFTWQVNDRNEFKAGAQFRQNTFLIEDLDRSWVFRDNRDSLFINLPYPPARNFSNFEDYFDAVSALTPVLVPELERFAVNDRFDQSPIELAVFVQDKLEFDSRLVVKAGTRFEYFDVRERRLIDPRTPTDRLGREDNFTNTDAKFYISPRLGISYPISTRGAFRVAYGHFVQMPAYLEIFKNPVFAGINVGRLENREVGNPDLQPERTIKYEMGLQQQMTDFIGVDINLFYSNIRNLLGTELLSTLDNVQYIRTVNRDYGLVRGGTFSIVTRPVGMLLGTSFDVTYSDARGSSSNPDDVANVVIAGRSGEIGELFIDRQIISLDWDQTLTANLSATVGQSGNWNVGFISQLATGQPYSPAFLNPNLDFPDNEFLNAERKPFLFTFDLSAEKRINVGPISYGIRLQVENVFNHLNERFVDGISGRAGQIVRLPVVQADRNRVNEFVGLFDRAKDDNNPHWYSSPRLVRLAVTVDF